MQMLMRMQTFQSQDTCSIQTDLSSFWQATVYGKVRHGKLGCWEAGKLGAGRRDGGINVGPQEPAPIARTGHVRPLCPSMRDSGESTVAL